jgi:hypothetical protein
MASKPLNQSKSLNRSLHAAKAIKQDEFYTQLSDIEKELRHYSKHFKGKTVLCNCDDPKVSNFFHYFSHKFHTLGLKKLITTCYKNVDPDIFSKHEGKRGLRLVYNGELTPGGRVPSLSKLDTLPLEEDGDFRSDECIELLKQADIVVTNPPFSLFREYVEQLVKYKKKFVIIGSVNARHYREVFKLIKENRLWLGYNCTRFFSKPDGSIFETARTFWYTNLDIDKRHEEITLYANYSAAEYPRYDNLDAIDVSKTNEIPCDYDGLMGVPDGLLDNYNPDQFELIGIPFGDLGKEIGVTKNHRGRTDIAITRDGKSRCPYSRIIIKRKS